MGAPSQQEYHSKTVLFHPREWIVCVIIFISLGAVRIWTAVSMEEEYEKFIENGTEVF